MSNNYRRSCVCGQFYGDAYHHSTCKEGYKDMGEQQKECDHEYVSTSRKMELWSCSKCGDVANDSVVMAHIKLQLAVAQSELSALRKVAEAAVNNQATMTDNRMFFFNRFTRELNDAINEARAAGYLPTDHQKGEGNA